MCAVSNIGDYGQRVWSNPSLPAESPFKMPQFPYNPPPSHPFPQQFPVHVQPAVSAYNGPTREQFEEFMVLLRAAKKFDEATGQPHCEQDEKLAWLKAIAKHLGVPEPVL